MYITFKSNNLAERYYILHAKFFSNQWKLQHISFYLSDLLGLFIWRRLKNKIKYAKPFNKNWEEHNFDLLLAPYACMWSFIYWSNNIHSFRQRLVFGRPDVHHMFFISFCNFSYILYEIDSQSAFSQYSKSWW